MVLEMEKSRIKIVFYTDWVHDRTFSPMVMVFYYKNNSDYLYYKEITFNVEDIRKQNSSSSIDHLEKNFEIHEKILFYSQYKASRDDVIRIFDFLIGATTGFQGMDKDVDEFHEKKNEMLNNIRRNRIKNILNSYSI